MSTFSGSLLPTVFPFIHRRQLIFLPNPGQIGTNSLSIVTELITGYLLKAPTFTNTSTEGVDNSVIKIFKPTC